jgi:hypothetical protein
MFKRTILITALVIIPVESSLATVDLQARTDKDVYYLGEPITVYIDGSGFPTVLQFSTSCQVDYIMDSTYDSYTGFCLFVITYAYLPCTWTIEHPLSSYKPSVGLHSVEPYMHDYPEWWYYSWPCFFEVITYDGDINRSGRVDFVDCAILANAWKSTPSDDNWDPSCNLAEPNDIIDEQDLKVLTQDWLMGF